jgi:hypothetical protein
MAGVSHDTFMVSGQVRGIILPDTYQLELVRRMSTERADRLLVDRR